MSKMIHNVFSSSLPGKRLWQDLAICTLLIVVGIASREAMETWPNFKPAGAICIWAGLLVSRLWLALLVPPLMMAISDVGIGGPGLGLAMAVQLALIVNLVVCRSARTRLTRMPEIVPKHASGSAAGRCGWGAMLIGAGSVQFFLTTNFAVWASATWYPATAAGLASCYVAGIPFFWNTLCGDLLFGWTPLVVMQVSHAAAIARNREHPAWDVQ